MRNKRTLSMRQGGERTYITPVTFSYADYFTVNMATNSIKCFIKALLMLFRSNVFVAYGEAERPYNPGPFDSTLTWNKGTHIGGFLHVLWFLLMEAVLFFAVLLSCRSRFSLRYFLIAYQNSTLVFGETFDTGLPTSVYGYMQVDYADSKLVTGCYMDVADEVIVEDLRAHRDYDFEAEAASYDHDRGVFMVSDNTVIGNLLAWIDSKSGEDRVVTYLRNIDT